MGSVWEQQKWPDILWLVRHGESAGNVARDEAEAAGKPMVDIADRDVDVPLSETGRGQAKALGEWFGKLPPDQRPTAILTSPYLRARTTAEITIDAARIAQEEIQLIVDERLREREFGILDRLTKVGIRERYPEQAELRGALGKFYHRPPGGESWCDVILRLRSLIDTLTRDYRGERVMIVTHQVVVLCFRYLLERMTEEEVLAIDREADIPNCAITSYEYDPTLGRNGKLAIHLYNYTTPLRDEGKTITTAPDVPAGQR